MSGSINTGLLPPMYTVAEVAIYCKVSVRQVRRWIKLGELQTVQIGRLRRILANDLALFLTKCKKE